MITLKDITPDQIRGAQANPVWQFFKERFIAKQTLVISEMRGTPEKPIDSLMLAQLSGRIQAYDEVINAFDGFVVAKMAELAAPAISEKLSEELLDMQNLEFDFSEDTFAGLEDLAERLQNGNG